MTEWDILPHTNLTEMNAAGLNIVPGMHAQPNCTEHYLAQLEVEQDSAALEDLDAGEGEPSEECLDANLASFYEYDSNGLLGDVFIWLPYDGRIRPWYQQAVANYEASGRTKRFLWSEIYLFTPDAEGNVNQGITSTAVITAPGNKTGDVMGVLAVDAQLSHVSKYLQDTFADTDLVVFLVERATKMLVASSNEYPVVDPEDGVTRLDTNTTGDDLIKGVGAVLDDVDWAVNKTIYTQYDVMTSDFNDGRGVDWIVVIVSPIQCDANQYFRAGDCIDCPFLTTVNADPLTSVDMPCVCEKGMFDISTADVSGAFCFERSFVANPLDDMDGYEHYRADKVEKGLQCSTCPDCIDCDTNRGMLVLKPGWKTIDLDDSTSSLESSMLDRLRISTDMVALRCPIEGACLGDVVENGTIRSECAPGYDGHLCAVCADGYTFTTSGCEECSTKSMLVIPILAIALIFFAIVYSLFEAWFTEGGAAYADLFFEVERLLAPIGKVLITTSQIVGSIPLTMNVTFPPAMMALVNFLRIFALDVFVILRTNCLFGNSFYAKFYSSIFIPVIVIALFFGYSSWKASQYQLPDLAALTHKQRKNLRDEYESLSKRGGPENNEVTAADIAACCEDIGVDMSVTEIETIISEGDKNHSGALDFEQFLAVLNTGSGKFSDMIIVFDRRRHMQGVFAIVGVVIFMLYPGVCQTAFAALRCRDLGPGVSVLEADYNVDCTSSKYELFRVSAFIAILLVPIGIPVGAFLLMRRHEEKILAGDVDTLREFNVLVGDYEPQFYYWECIELARKLILAGFVSIPSLCDGTDPLASCSSCGLINLLVHCRLCSSPLVGPSRLRLRSSFRSASLRCPCGAHRSPTRRTIWSRRSLRSQFSWCF
eukprot:COSAG02_NODE_1203_length_13900_cov_11.040287_7_plen_880_part_00